MVRKHFVLPPLLKYDGCNVETDTNDDLSSKNMDLNILQLWQQFLKDMAIKSPVVHGATSLSYLKLSVNARISV